MFGSACMHARTLKYLDVLVLHRACVSCIHAHVTHAQCDITWVHIYCESCQHDVIGICIPFIPYRNDVAWDHWCSYCINTMSSWCASHWHDVGITSSCPHHVCIMCVTSSHSHCDAITIIMNHDCSPGA